MANQRKPVREAIAESLGELIAVLDLETDPFKEGRIEINPFVAGFYDGKRMEIFWGADCIPRLVALLMKLKPGTIVYAHNGGNFDFHFLLEFLPVNDCKFLCMGKRIVQIKIPVGYGKDDKPLYIELRDSFSIIPKKLAAFSKDEIDYTWFEKPVRETHKRAIVDYLKSDLRNNREMVLGFLKRFPAKVTLASSVFELMKKRFDYDPGRSNVQYDSKFRPFFFGGRVQFWKLGELKGRYQIVDINSAYPWAMTQNHWFGFESTAQTTIPKKNAEQAFYVVECFSDGAFPVREKNGSVAFPHAAGRYFVSGWELMAAKQLKLVRDLEILVCYVPSEIKSMRNFSQTLYDAKNAAKQAGDKEEEFFNKIAVNAGYGKLALNVSRFSEVKVTSLYDKPEYREGNTEDGKIISEAKAEKEGQSLWENCWDDKDRELSFWKRSSYREGIDKFINVATAASITGCVRAFMLRSMKKCRDVVYCDTDSIIAADVSPLKMSDKLGDWKLEMNCCQVFIAGKKLYAATDGTKWKKACKGVNLSHEKIAEVARGKYMGHQSIAPTYSFFSKPKFVTREVKRADMPKRKKVVAKRG